VRNSSLLRLLALALVAVMAVAAGCGRDDDGGGGEGGTASAPGCTDSEIHLGGSYPFSGPASAYASIEKGVQARFAEQNANGGVNGRQIEFTTYDDGYEPAKALTNVRRLITQDQVFALFNTLGTPNNLAIWDYVNQQKVPHLFVATGASDWGEDIQAHPYTTGWQPNYVDEARIYADYLKKEKPNAKVAALYQNDDFGQDLLGGFEEAIQGSNIEIVARESYEVTDPTITSQMSSLAASGADTFLNITTPKFSAQAIAAVARSDWQPLHILNNVGASKTLVLTPVGLENAQGIVSSNYFMDPESPDYRDEPAVQEYREAVAEHQPDSNPNESFVMYGWTAGSTMIAALEELQNCDREALMDIVRSIDVEIPTLLPGVRLTMNGEQDTYPIQGSQMMRFEGENWQFFGDVIDATTLVPGGSS